jgi:hypothetical protein
MKIAKTLFCLLTVVSVFAVSAYAGPPLVGIYTSEAGQVSHGRYTESFANNGDFLTVGNAVNAASWDGATLGVQWTIHCPDIVSTLLIADMVNPLTGNGQKLYKKFFSGGAFTLNGTGEAWDGGDAIYSGVIDSYQETVSIIYSNFQRVNADADISWTGHFNGSYYPCVQWTANGATLDDTSGGATLPPDYPVFVDPNTCDPGRIYGIWWQMTDVAMTILDCTVPTKEETWGAVKTLYE